MGSIAQDNRHEEMFQKAKNEVYKLENEIQALKDKLSTLDSKYQEATNHLSMMEDIDLKRD